MKETFIQRQREIILGVAFGAGYGLLYGLISQMINRWVLAGVPLEQPLNGLLSVIFLYILGGAAMGVISCWPASTLVGCALGGLAGGFVSLLSGLATASDHGAGVLGAFFLFVYTFLPLVVVTMPVAWVIRAAVNAQTVDPLRPAATTRWRTPVLLAAVVSVVGLTSIYPSEVRQAFHTTHTLLQQAADPAASSLPGSLRGIEGLSAHTGQSYRLSWVEKTEDIWAGTGMEEPDAVRDLSQTAIRARYQDGFSLLCIYYRGNLAPACTNR